MGALFFLVALLTWEIVALIVMSGSLSAFLKSLGDPLVGMELFFNGLYALPIVLYIAAANEISEYFKGRTRLVAFLGFSLIGAFLLAAFLRQSPNWAELQKIGIIVFLAYPTACVLILDLARLIFRLGEAPGREQRS